MLFGLGFLGQFGIASGAVSIENSRIIKIHWHSDILDFAKKR